MVCIAFAILAVNCGSLACSPISNLLVIVQVICLALESNLPGKKENIYLVESPVWGLNSWKSSVYSFFDTFPPIMNTERITSRYVDM